MNLTMNNAAEIIQKIGVSSLGRNDGCACTHFSIRGITVDVSCRKSASSDWGGAPGFHGNIVRVYRDTDDVSSEEMEQVAKAVTADMWDGSKSIVRYCEFEQDRDCKCLYCGKEREATAYVCTDCKTHEWGKHWDFSRLEFIEHVPAD